MRVKTFGLLSRLFRTLSRGPTDRNSAIGRLIYLALAANLQTFEDAFQLNKFDSKCCES